MSKAFAIIIDGKVSNVALFESLEFAQQDVSNNAILVEITEDMITPAPDSIWDGENFYPVFDVEEPVVELTE